MRVDKRIWIVISILALLVGSLAGCGQSGGGQAPAEEEKPAAPPASVDGETLVQERCTKCHGLERVTGVQKEREGWEQTVDRMIAKGAELDESEKAAVIEYLAEAYGP